MVIDIAKIEKLEHTKQIVVATIFVFAVFFALEDPTNESDDERCNNHCEYCAPLYSYHFEFIEYRAFAVG
jgi:hypothetical protein